VWELGRPSGTCIGCAIFPALKRWAKLGCPSGAALSSLVHISISDHEHK
jgi:hypothetical protein